MATRGSSQHVAAEAAPGHSHTSRSTLPDLGGDLASLREFLADVARYTEPSPSPHTTRARETDWKDFSAWCDRSGLETLPALPTTVALYLTSLAQGGLKFATINRRLATIAHVHRVGGHAVPTREPEVQEVLAGLGVALGRDKTQKAPLSRADVMLMLEFVENGDPLDGVTETAARPIAAVRDKALLLVGFSLALRRSELVAIRVEDLSRTPEGYSLRVTQTRADRGNGIEALTLSRTAWNRPCPVRALDHWLTLSGITYGPVFRSVARSGKIMPAGMTAQSVALIVKKWAGAAGLDPSQLSGHSLRSGFATQAAQDGHHAVDIARVTRHRGTRDLDSYVRDGRREAGVPRVL